MIYNLSPILNLLTPDRANADIWRERIQSFFTNEEFDPELQDMYYDVLLKNLQFVDYLFSKGNLVDSYTGLFSIPVPFLEHRHTFNLAHFISDNYQHFFKKRILTVCNDFGILNVQLKMCGLDLVSSIQSEELISGTVLTCIGNNCPPYPINKLDFDAEDVIILSCVFQEDDLAYKNWQLMLDKKSEGKEVFFTSNTFQHLRNYVNYDRLEVVTNPQKIYMPEDYANLIYGYTNKIYRVK